MSTARLPRMPTDAEIEEAKQKARKLGMKGDEMKDRATPDDPATCGICGHETSLAMIATHLATEHDVDVSEIKNAPVVDLTEVVQHAEYAQQVTAIARAFHDRYEALSGQHGWETQERTRVAWEDLPEENRSLMIAVVRELLRDGVIAVGYLSTAGGGGD
jgi:hypothetical protein